MYSCICSLLHTSSPKSAAPKIPKWHLHERGRDAATMTWGSQSEHPVWGTQQHEAKRCLLSGTPMHVRGCTHTRTHARTHAHAHARAHTHICTHTMCEAKQQLAAQAARCRRVLKISSGCSHDIHQKILMVPWATRPVERKRTAVEPSRTGTAASAGGRPEKCKHRLTANWQYRMMNRGLIP